MKWLVILAFLLFSSVPAQSFDWNNNGKIIHFSRVAHIQGVIDPSSEWLFWGEIMLQGNTPGDQLILIDSEGGEVPAGEAVLDTIYALKRQGRRVICMVNGTAASMAFNILTRCDERYATKESHLLFHKIAAGEFVFEQMTPKNLRARAAELELEDEAYRTANASALHMTLTDYDYYADRDQEWTAEELLKKGYLNGLVKMNGQADKFTGPLAPKGR